jgi:GR25 family glycosyltransferase involved in LPS biosynthesis
MRAVSCSTLERTCAMLILEDDAVFHSKFLSSFRQLWSSVPDKWDNTFLGFCHVGTKQGVLETEQNSAYARRSRAAAKLMYYMPGVGPIETWQADNAWSGLNVYSGVMGESTCSIGQRRADLKNHIVHSAHLRNLQDSPV